MPTYATAAQLRTYTGLDATAMPDATANALLTKAERDIDSIAILDRPIDAATGLRFNPTTLSTVEALTLQRATCAQAEYRHEMGNEFFIRGQYQKTTGPNYSTEGKLGTIGPATWRELNGNGFIKLTTTTAGHRQEWKPQPDFPQRHPRTEFELG